MAETKNRLPLTSNQLHILTLMYKFRFVTIPLLTQYLGLKQQTTILRTLRLLEEQGYVARKFDLSYKIDRKPALYWLTAKGVAVFKEDARFNRQVLHSYYKNKSLSDAFMKHAVDVFATYNRLKSTYKDAYDIYTKQELAGFDDFPETKPDLFLKGEQEHFITLAHDVQPFLIRKRLAEYIEHSEEDGWPSGDYPSLLFIFGSGSDEARFLDYAKRALESAGIDEDELVIGTTTQKALNQGVSEIWTFVGEDRLPKAL